MTAVDDKQVTKTGDETTLPFAPVQPESQMVISMLISMVMVI